MAASMEPRRHRRGNDRPLVVPGWKPKLQWSRDVTVAETMVTGGVYTASGSVLQWSRDVTVAETCVSGA